MLWIIDRITPVKVDEAGETAGLGIVGKEVTTAHWSELYDRRCVAVCVLVHNRTSWI